jgi:UDP-N-acetyl-D-mannosaminuronate dehydrogenase
MDKSYHSYQVADLMTGYLLERFPQEQRLSLIARYFKALADAEAGEEAFREAFGLELSDFLQEYSIELVTEEEVREADCIVILAAHDCYRSRSLQDLRKLYKKDCKAPVLIDVRNIYSRKEAEKLGFVYWSL